MRKLRLTYYNTIFLLLVWYTCIDKLVLIEMKRFNSGNFLK